MNELRLLATVLVVAAIVFGVLTYKTYKDGDPSMETNAWAAFTCLSLGVLFWALVPYFERLLAVLR